MSFFEKINLIFESLSKPFYSEKEAFEEKFKDSSQNFEEKNLEIPYLTYDPFGLYTSSNFLGLGNFSNINQNFNDLVKKWRELATLPEVDEAISEISSEAIVFDEIDPPVEINLDDIDLPDSIKEKIHESWDKIMYLLDFNEKGDELFRQWYIDGILTLEVVYNNKRMKDGIQKLISLPPFNIFRYRDEKTNQIKWLINQNPNTQFSQEKENMVFLDEQITQINSGIYSPDKKIFYSPLQKATKAINQLYLLEDTLLIYRLTRSTEKRVFYIDTGNLPKSKAEEFVRNMMSRYRQKKVYDTEKGQIENAPRSISILEDFWFPISSTTGKGTRVETLPGSQSNFGSFEDIEYWIDKVYSALNIPKSRRNKDSILNVQNAISIEREEMKFYKYIQKLRRRFNNLFVDLLKKDLLAKQVLSLNDWKKIQEKIKFKYAESNELSLIKKNQILEMQINTANLATQLIDPSVGVIDKTFIQKNILRLTETEIKEIEERLLQSQIPSDETGMKTDTEEDSFEGYEEVGPDLENQEEIDSEEEIESEDDENDEDNEEKKENFKNNLLDILVDGDIVTDGKNKFLFENGQLKKI